MSICSENYSYESRDYEYIFMRRNLRDSKISHGTAYLCPAVTEKQATILVDSGPHPNS